MRKKRRVSKLLKLYAEPFLYMILFNTSLVLSIVVIHEAGHAAMGSFLGCKNIKIVIYDEANPNTFTQMNCSPGTPLQPLALAGFLLVIPYAALFMLLKRFAERYFFAVVIGFNFLLSTTDIFLATKSSALSVIFVAAGAIIIVAGESLFIDKITYRKL